MCGGSQLWKKTISGKVRQEGAIMDVHLYFAETTNAEGRLLILERWRVPPKQVFSQMVQGICRRLRV